MKFTDEELLHIERWEPNILTAMRSNYLRNVGRSGLLELVAIYERVTGTAVRVNTNCATCILSFLQKFGAIYFAYKDKQTKKEARKARREERSPGNEE